MFVRSKGTMCAFSAFWFQQLSVKWYIDLLYLIGYHIYRISTWELYSVIYTLSKSPIHLSFIHMYQFDTLSLAVWQDTCHTYKNLVYDLAHHESPIAQWLERPTGIWKVMGSTPVGGSENSFSEYFDLRTLLHYLHFIQVTNPFIIYSSRCIGKIFPRRNSFLTKIVACHPVPSNLEP